MKQILSVLLIITISLITANRLAAQETFSSFEVMNRVILINYADTIDQDVKTEILSLFKGIRKKIDGVEWVHVADLSNSSQGFDQAITVTFTSEAGIETYETHPDHKRIQELAQDIVQDIATYEFWEKME